jgi:DNA-directed RNA polymerase subunit H (RpoH/RPB5)
MYSYRKDVSVLNRNLSLAEFYILFKELNEMMVTKRQLIPYIYKIIKNEMTQEIEKIILEEATEKFGTFKKKQNFEDFVYRYNDDDNNNNTLNLNNVNILYSSSNIEEENLTFTLLKSINKKDKGKENEDMAMEVENKKKCDIYSVHWLIKCSNEITQSVTGICAILKQNDKSSYFNFKNVITIVDVGISTKNTNDILNLDKECRPKIFYTFQLSNPENHLISSTFEKLEEEKIKKLLKNLGTRKENSGLPKISLNDPIVKYNDWELKDVLKVTTKNFGMNTFMESNIEYFIVV